MRRSVQVTQRNEENILFNPVSIVFVQFCFSIFLKVDSLAGSTPINLSFLGNSWTDKRGYLPVNETNIAMENPPDQVDHVRTGHLWISIAVA